MSAKESFTHFYNMGFNPFTKRLSAHDAYSSDDIVQVHARLDYLCRSGGIGLITADPGMGKTFAVRTWSEHTNPNTTKIVYTCLSTVTNMDFYRLLCAELGLDPSVRKTTMYRSIQAWIRMQVEERRAHVVVIIDEAHYLNPSILHDLEMLANFDMDSRDMFALLLVGHTSLAEHLLRPVYESLRQRLVVHYRMRGLNEDQTKEYIRSMLLKSGADPDIFDDAALLCAYGIAAGSIRRLNSVVCNALTIGAQNKAYSIDAEMVRSAGEETII